MSVSQKALKTWAQDQKDFMLLGGQTTGVLNKAQLGRYMSHIEEESWEAIEAYEQDDLVALLDGLVDTIVVAIGAMHSLGIDPDRAWSIVHAANMRKFPDGKPYYRHDGQIGKPPGWIGPEKCLASLLDEVRLADRSTLEASSSPEEASYKEEPLADEN